MKNPSSEEKSCVKSCRTEKDFSQLLRKFSPVSQRSPLTKEVTLKTQKSVLFNNKPRKSLIINQEKYFENFFFGKKSSVRWTVPKISKGVIYARSQSALFLLKIQEAVQF